MSFFRALLGLDSNQMLSTVTQAMRSQSLVTKSSMESTVGRTISDTEYNRVIERAFGKLMADVLADGRFDPAEEQMVSAVTRLYGVTLNHHQSGALLRAKAIYNLETGDLHPMPSSFALKRGENCFFEGMGTAGEQRTQTIRTTSHGGRVRVRIAKGVSYSFGSSTSRATKQDYIHSFGDGKFAITDKRFLMSVAHKSISIPFEKLINVEYYNDGLLLSKDTGKPLLVTFPVDQVVALVMARCLDGDFIRQPPPIIATVVAPPALPSPQSSGPRRLVFP